MTTPLSIPHGLWIGWEGEGFMHGTNLISLYPPPLGRSVANKTGKTIIAVSKIK